MTKIALNEVVVRNLPLPPKGQARYWDKSLPGFGLRVSQGGAKTWIVLDPRSRTRTQETIGRYPVLSLQDARTAAKKHLAGKTLGKRETPRVSWNRASREFLEEIGGKRREKTHREYSRVLRHLKYGETLLSDLDLVRKVTDANTYMVARAFMNWCVKRGYLEETPLKRVECPKSYTPRERVLSDDELKAVWQNLEPGTFGDVVKLLILTGQRFNETTHLHSDMIDGRRVTLPSWLTKNGRAHSFPLGATGAAIVSGKTGLLFPASGKHGVFKGYWKGKVRLDAASGVAGYTLHDLRRTFASGLASIGVALPVIEKLLNHRSGSFKGIVSVYQKYEFWDEQVEAIEKWEAKIAWLLQPA